MTDDKYTYSESGGILINRLGIRDPHKLDQALNYAASRAWAHLDRQGPPERPDAAYLAHIHRTMFSPLLGWAGDIRDVDAGATGTSIAYARPAFIDDQLRDLFDQLHQADYYRGLPLEQFADELGGAWGTLTAIHPFRDGNTRSQSAYVSILTARAGYEIDWPAIDVDQLRDARLAAVPGHDAGLRELLKQHIHKPAAAGERPRARPPLSILRAQRATIHEQPAENPRRHEDRRRQSPRQEGPDVRL